MQRPIICLSSRDLSGIWAALTVTAAVSSFLSPIFGANTSFLSSTAYRIRCFPLELSLLPRRQATGLIRQQQPAESGGATFKGPTISAWHTTAAPVSSIFSQSRCIGAARENSPLATMAWRSHGRSNRELVDHLRRNGVFSDQRVYETMVRVRLGMISASDRQRDIQSTLYKQLDTLPLYRLPLKHEWPDLPCSLSVKVVKL